jgi:outer membrane protein OmpA-like peptidoglycan-associated protein
MRREDFFGRLKIAITLLVILCLPWIPLLESQPGNPVRVAVYFDPENTSEDLLDQARNSIPAKRIPSDKLTNTQIWEINDKQLKTLEARLAKIGAFYDPAPLDNWYLPTANNGHRPTSGAQVVRAPAYRSRFAYLTGRWIDAFRNSPFPIDVPVSPNAKTFYYISGSGRREIAEVLSVTALSPRSFSYHIRLANGLETDIHVSPDGETGTIPSDANTYIELIATGRGKSIAIQRAAFLEADHPTRKTKKNRSRGGAAADAEVFTPRPQSELACPATGGSDDTIHLNLEIGYTTDAWRMLQTLKDANGGNLVPAGTSSDVMFKAISLDLRANLNSIYQQINFGSDVSPIHLQFDISGVDSVAWEKSTSAEIHNPKGQDLTDPADFSAWLRMQLLSPRTSKEAELQSLMLTKRKGAQIVLLLVGDSFSAVNADMPGFYGLSGAVRAKPTESFSLVRTDAALPNLTAAHEIAHLLGARHQIWYRCSKVANGADCPLNPDAQCLCDASENEQDQYDLAELKPVNPPTGVPANRAYVAQVPGTSTRYGSITSTRSVAPSYSPNAAITRVPYLSDKTGVTGAGWSIGDEHHDEVAAIKAFTPCLAKSPVVTTTATDDSRNKLVGSGGDVESFGDDKSIYHPREETKCVNGTDCPNDAFASLGYTFYFNSGSSEIRCDEQAKLPKLIRLLRTAGVNKAYVEGFADTAPPKDAKIDPDKYNRQLSLERAQTIAYEISTTSRDFPAICYAGQGKHLLSAPTDDGTKMWKNRRVEMNWSLRCPADRPAICEELTTTCLSSGSHELSKLKSTVDKRRATAVALGAEKAGQTCEEVAANQD